MRAQNGTRLGLCLLPYFGPSVFALAWAAPAVVLFGLCLPTFWMFAVYGISNAVAALVGMGSFQFSAFSFQNKAAVSRSPAAAMARSVACPGSSARIALLYPTRNDLREEAVARRRPAGGVETGGIPQGGGPGGTVRLGALPGYFAASTYAHLAGLVAESLSALVFAVTGRAGAFRVTNDATERSAAAADAAGAGDRRTATGQGAGAGRRRCGGRDGFHPNHPLVFALEVAMGAGFLAAAWGHKNLWFVGPGVALLLSPLVAWLGWEKRWVRALAAIPALAMTALMALIAWQLVRFGH